MAKITRSSEFMKNILGSSIRQERKAQKMSQQSLGELAGTGLNFVSQLERGKSTGRAREEHGASR